MEQNFPPVEQLQYIKNGATNMYEDSISRHLGRFVSQLTYEHLSKDQIYKVKTYFLDWIGSAIAGQDQPPIKIMLEVVHSLGGKPESTVIPDSSRTMSLLAAMVNGASSHVVEMDDLHRESIFHPAAAIMPAIFAMAEREHTPGRKLIPAIAAGYEVGVRIALAVGPSHYYYWHTTATCGTFGAAAGCASILGLDEERVAWALGSAGTQAAGLWEFLVESAMSKQLHAGKAALNGVLSALLAQKGFTGAQRILEGKKGFFRATSREFDESKCLKGLGKEFLFERNSLKYHASCGHTHSAIDATLDATGKRSIMPDDIQEVKVYIYQEALDLLREVKPETPYLAKFSLPFCIAMALKYGHVEFTDFSTSRLKHPDIIQLMRKITLHSDSEFTRAYPNKWPARVEVITRDGITLKGTSDYPKGDPENPLSEEELFKKFKTLTDGLISRTASETIIERAMNLEVISDVGKFFLDTEKDY